MDHVEQALAPIITALREDGYDLEVEIRLGSLRCRVVALPGSCADCLVPPATMEALVKSALATANPDHGLEVVVTYDGIGDHSLGRT